MKKHKFHLKLTDNQTNEVHECDADVLIVNMAVKNPNNPLLQSTMVLTVGDYLDICRLYLLLGRVIHERHFPPLKEIKEDNK